MNNVEKIKECGVKKMADGKVELWETYPYYFIIKDDEIKAAFYIPGLITGRKVKEEIKRFKNR